MSEKQLVQNVWMICRKIWGGVEMVPKNCPNRDGFVVAHLKRYLCRDRQYNLTRAASWAISCGMDQEEALAFATALVDYRQPVAQ